jgi:hypothetical protein
MRFTRASSLTPTGLLSNVEPWSSNVMLPIFAAGAVGGIGFTISLFPASGEFFGTQNCAAAKIAIAFR